MFSLSSKCPLSDHSPSRQRLAPNRTQLECIVNSDIPWGDAVFEVTPGENAGKYCRSVMRRAGKRAGWVWRAYLRAPCCKALGVVCAGLSGVILWSEVGFAQHQRQRERQQATSNKHSFSTKLMVSPRFRHACKVGMNRSSAAQMALLHATRSLRFIWRAERTTT